MADESTVSVSNQKTCDETILFVDARSKAEFNEGSIPHAINTPLLEIENNLKKLKAGKKIVVFCRSGSRSAQAKLVLEQHHIPKVIDRDAIVRFQYLVIN